MTISYNWLSEYLPISEVGMAEILAPEKLAKILTSIGLEVESMERHERVKGVLQGMFFGEFLTC